MTTKCEDIQSLVSLVDADTGVALIGGAVRLKGCSVTIGIGDMASSVSINLVTDFCLRGSPSIPNLGTPAIFTCRNLVFGGIINNLSYSESSNGFEYTVDLIDPKKTLDGVKILLKGYFCKRDPTVPNAFVKNFINVNALLEEDVAVCPPGLDSQNWPRIGDCGNFGLAGGNNRGPFLWRVLEKIQGEYGGGIGGSGSSLYTTSGRSIYISMAGLVGYVKARAPYARVSDLQASLSDLITRACDYASCDYMVLLVGLHATVYLIDRSATPSYGYIQGLIVKAQQEQILINGTIGNQEIYAKSNNFVLGDQVNYLAERSNRGNAFAMMLGEDLAGDPVRVYNMNFTASINITPILEILSAGGFAAGLAPMFSIKEEELLSCGTLQAWRTYGLCKANGASLSSRISDILGFKPFLTKAIDAIGRLQQNAPQAGDIPTGCNFAHMYTDVAINKRAIIVEKQVYTWLKKFIDTYYGRYWLIPMNNICMTPNNPGARKVRAGELYDFTDEPVSDGYPGPNQNRILGLTYGLNTTRFETGDGKIKAFIRVDTTVGRNVIVGAQTMQQEIDYSQLDPEECQVIDRFLYVPAAIEGTMYRNTNLNPPQPEVLLKTEIVPTTMVVGQNNVLFSKGLKAFSYFFGTGNVGNVKDVADKESLNVLGFVGATAGLQDALVPMKSNIYVYGPWFYTAGALGSTEVSQDLSLNPWTCGGYANMNFIGQSSAQLGLRSSNQEESGRMELAEAPGYSIQSFIRAGVLIDNIVVSYNSNGATTSYSFKQHAQKFGNYNQVLAERLKKGVKDRDVVLDRLRKQKLITQGRVNSVQKDIWTLEHIHDKASPGFCLVGSYSTPVQPGSSSTTTVAGNIPTTTDIMKCSDLCETEPPTPPESNNTITDLNNYTTHLFDPNDWGSMSGGATALDIQNYAALSLDAIFAPVSLLGRGGRLARYVSNWDRATNYYRTRPSMPPIAYNAPLAINQTYLNPILSKTILDNWDTRSQSQNKGVYISRISFGTNLGDIVSAGPDRYDASTDFGFFSLRGPLVLQSWGYDTENKPIPNAMDTETNASNGVFVNSKLKNKFMGNWLKNPKTWPVGPIDLRYDRERGVWVSPPAERIVVAQLTSDLMSRGSAEAVLINPKNTADNNRTFYDKYHIDGASGEDLGQNLHLCKITVFDYLGNNLSCGTIVYAMHNDQRYIVIGSSTGASTGGHLNASVGSNTIQKLQLPWGEKARVSPSLYPLDEYAITETGNAKCCTGCEDKPEEFCPTDAYGLSDCVKDIYGRTLLPVISKDSNGDTLVPPFSDNNTVKIPWGGKGTKDKNGNDEGPFGRSAKLPEYSSFASGVLGIDGNGCLKIYPFTSCAIVDPPATSPPATPAPTPTGPSISPIPTTQTGPITITSEDGQFTIIY